MCNTISSDANIAALLLLACYISDDSNYGLNVFVISNKDPLKTIYALHRF